jgi:hypothetical protein
MGVQMEVDLVERHTKIAIKRAWSFQKTTGLNFDELKSVAFDGLSKAAGKYRSDMHVKFPSFAQRCIDNRIMRHLKETNRLNRSKVGITDETRGYEEMGELEDIKVQAQGNYCTRPDYLYEFKEKIENCSNDAQTALRVLFSYNCHTILQISPNHAPKKIRGALKRYLRENKGWKWERVTECLQELRALI